MDGAHLWVATGYGVSLFERTADGLAPLDTVALPGSTRVVVASGTGTAYAGSGSQIFMLRRDGTRIAITGSAGASGTVNDILLTSRLFVATTDGIDHYDIVDPATLIRSDVELFTTLPNVSSLAVSGSTLYAADGDATVELFSLALPGLPQHTGTVSAMPFASTVHTTADGRLVVSDRFGQATEVFAGATRIARAPMGSSSFAATGAVWFLAGPDRTLRAADFSDPGRVAELYETILPASGGNDNGIHAIARSGDDVYVAAGDIGIITLHAAAIRKPYPLVGYAETTSTTSVAMQGDRAWFGSGDKVSEMLVVPAGLSLQPQRSWTAGPGTVVHDATGDFVLTSSGSSATLWLRSSNPPAAAVTASLPSPVTSAVIRDSGFVTALADGTVWRADPQTSRVASAPAATQIVRSGGAVAIVEIREEGTTTLHYYATGDLSAKTRELTLPGAAVGSVALDATDAALFTFAGINLVDLDSGSVSTIAGSSGVIPRALVFAGEDLLAMDGRSLYVYDGAETLLRAHPLPAVASAMAASADHAVFATSEGTAAMSPRASLPVVMSRSASRFYTKLAATEDSVALFGLDGLDLFSTASGSAPRYRASIATSPVVDIAANATTLFTLTAGGTVRAWSDAGVVIAETTLDEGPEAIARRIIIVGNAIWVSIFKGCSTGTCLATTVVLDPTTLAITGSMSGIADDVASSGTQTWTLTDLPREMRVIDTSDPLHPTVLVGVPRPQSSVSIAYSGNEVLVLADRVYLYEASTLAPAGERLDASTVTSSDRIRVHDGCAAVTGRGPGAVFYSLPDWSVARTFETPSSVRALELENDRLLLLTTHSLEVWSLNEPQPASRRRAVR